MGEAAIWIIVVLVAFYYFTNPSDETPSPKRIPELARFRSKMHTQLAWRYGCQKLRWRRLVLFLLFGLPASAVSWVALLLAWRWIVGNPGTSRLLNMVDGAVHGCIIVSGLLVCRYVTVRPLKPYLVQLLQDYLVELDQPRCPRCKYNLTGNISGTCPECGAALSGPSNMEVGQENSTEEPDIRQYRPRGCGRSAGVG